MTSAMSFDIRLPIGSLFTVLGLIMSGYGLATSGDAAHYAPSLGVNINLWWGLVMLTFGVLMLAAAVHARRGAAARLATKTAEGAATEERERRLGLERERRGE
jgi:membrane protein implicated in regulation of membrane protease activity